MAAYLQIENISKSYGPKVLFEHISFHINEGDKIALIAPNGTGKTSLLRILSGQDKSDSGGKILFLKDIRIAFLEQEYRYDPEKNILRQIMDDSTAWTAGLDSEHFYAYEQRVQQLLTSFGLLPERTMAELSGGELRRTAIARTLCMHPPVILADEPTGDLDDENTQLVFACFRKAAEEGASVLIVSHESDALNIADAAFRMDGGQLTTLTTGS